MPYVELPAGRFYYRYDGAIDAPLLVLSNSLGTDHTMWEPQMAAFTQHFRVLRYDSRGHGMSIVAPGPYSIADLGQDVLHLFDALQINQAHYCGLSMGGMVGIWVAAQAPDLIDRLILCNTAARLGPPQLWDARIAAVLRGGMAAIASAVIVRWFTPAFMSQSPGTLDRMRQMLIHTPPSGYIACCEAIRDMDQRTLLPHIRAKSLVIAGSLDAASPPADGRFLQATIAGAEYLELEAAHMTNIEVEQPYTEAVLRFLTA